MVNVYPENEVNTLQPLHDEDLVDLLQQVSRALAGQLKAICAAHGLPFFSVGMLRHVMLDPGLTVSAMARHSGIAKSYVSRVLEDLARQGLVEKRLDPADQRLVRVYASAAGLELMQQISQDVRRRLAAITAAVPGQTAAALVEGLRLVRGALDELNRGEDSACSPSSK